MSEIRELMLEVYKAHQDFKKEWDDWRHSGKKPAEHKRDKISAGQEPKKLSAARARLLSAFGNLWEQRLAPLQNQLLKDPHPAIDDLIEFLLLEIPAHRCGYAKGWFLTRLKQIDLTPEEKTKIQNAAL